MARKTMKNRHSVAKLHEHSCTFKGLHHWYEAKFEKLGWMLLAKAKGHNEKVNSYKTGIRRLLASLEHVISEYHDPDHIHDLRVLHMHTMVLQDFVTKHL